MNIKNHINIVIPMAGAGSRFSKAGYKKPKPLIDVKGKTMLEWAVSSFDFLKEKYKIKYIFVVLKEHIEKYNLENFIKNKYINSEIIILDEITRGQAETVYKAKNFINNDEKLIIYNADTYSNYELEKFPINNDDIDGIIPCFYAESDRYSYVKLNENGYAIEVVEKKVISNNATNGLYYFKKGRDFIKSAEEMFLNNELSGGEFYVGPLYNKLISNGQKIIISEIKENWVLGTPEELDYFLKNYKG